MTTWPASHRALRALSGRETACVLKLDRVDPVGVVAGDVADRHAPVDPLCHHGTGVLGQLVAGQLALLAGGGHRSVSRVPCAQRALEP